MYLQIKSVECHHYTFNIVHKTTNQFNVHYRMSYPFGCQITPWFEISEGSYFSTPLLPNLVGCMSFICFTEANIIFLMENAISTFRYNYKHGCIS